MNKIIISLIIIFTSMVIYNSYNSKISSLEYSISDFKNKTHHLNYELESLKAQNKSLKDTIREYLTVIDDYEAREKSRIDDKNNLNNKYSGENTFANWSDKLFKKSPAQVIQLLGPPDHVFRREGSLLISKDYPGRTNDRFKTTRLVYSDRVIDTLSGKKEDLTITVVPRFDCIYSVQDDTGNDDMHPTFYFKWEEYMDEIYGDKAKLQRVRELTNRF